MQEAPDNPLGDAINIDQLLLVFFLPIGMSTPFSFVVLNALCGIKISKVRLSRRERDRTCFSAAHRGRKHLIIPEGAPY